MNVNFKGYETPKDYTVFADKALKELYELLEMANGEGHNAMIELIKKEIYNREKERNKGEENGSSFADKTLENLKILQGIAIVEGDTNMVDLIENEINRREQKIINSTYSTQTELTTALILQGKK